MLFRLGIGVVALILVAMASYWLTRFPNRSFELSAKELTMIHPEVPDVTLDHPRRVSSFGVHHAEQFGTGPGSASRCCDADSCRFTARNRAVVSLAGDETRFGFLTAIDGDGSASLSRCSVTLRASEYRGQRTILFRTHGGESRDVCQRPAVASLSDSAGDRPLKATGLVCGETPIDSLSPRPNMQLFAVPKPESWVEVGVQGDADLTIWDRNVRTSSLGLVLSRKTDIHLNTVTCTGHPGDRLLIEAEELDIRRVQLSGDHLKARVLTSRHWRLSLGGCQIDAFSQQVQQTLTVFFQIVLALATFLVSLLGLLVAWSKRTRHPGSPAIPRKTGVLINERQRTKVRPHKRGPRLRLKNIR